MPLNKFACCNLAFGSETFHIILFPLPFMISKLCEVTIISTLWTTRVAIVFQNAHSIFFSCDTPVEYIMAIFSKIKNYIVFTTHNAFGMGEFQK